MTPRPLVFATLAVGDDYVDMAAACMRSARQHSQPGQEYYILHGLATEAVLKRFHLPWVHWISVDAEIDRRFPPEIRDKNRFWPRRLKGLLMNHPDLRDKDVVFVDADTLVFKPVDEAIRKSLDEREVLLFGSFQNDDYCHFRIPGYTFNLKTEAARVGLTLRNMNLNSGFMARRASPVGLRFAELLDDHLQRCPLGEWPGGYFNDEPYVMVAFQQALPEATECPLPFRRMVVTTHNGMVGFTPKNEVWVYKETSGQGWISEAAMIHFVGHQRTNHYRWLREQV